jgi:hypothetical protein
MGTYGFYASVRFQHRASMLRTKSWTPDIAVEIFMTGFPTGVEDIRVSVVMLSA